jgi:membrane-associated phospholipid phosphatase
MRLPRDHSADVTVGLIRVARVFSNIVSPPVMFAILGLAVALSQLPFWPGLAWAAVYGFFVSLAPILLIIYLLRSGRIGDLHMTLPRERRLPYLTSVVCALLVLALLYLLNGPGLMRCLVILNLINLTVLGLVNLYWLISIHTTAVMGTVIVGGLIFGAKVAVLLSPLVILVCWARYYLKRHTPAQLAAGLVLGALTPLGLTWVGCF